MITCKSFDYTGITHGFSPIQFPKICDGSFNIYLQMDHIITIFNGDIENLPTITGKEFKGIKHTSVYYNSGIDINIINIPTYIPGKFDIDVVKNITNSQISGLLLTPKTPIEELKKLWRTPVFQLMEEMEEMGLPEETSNKKDIQKFKFYLYINVVAIGFEKYFPNVDGVIKIKSKSTKRFRSLKKSEVKLLDFQIVCDLEFKTLIIFDISKIADAEEIKIIFNV